MTALPAAPGVVKTTIPFSSAGDANALSRIFIHYSGTAPTAAQLATYCDAVSTGWGAQMSPEQTAVWTQQAVQAEDLSSSTGATAGGSTSHVGTLASGTIPAASALMIQFLIARRYRGGKPKIFLPLGGTAQLDTGPVWSAAFRASVATAWANFIGVIAASGWTGAGTLTHVNVSYYNGFTVVTNPVTHRARNVPTLRGAPTVDPVTAYSVEVGVASQRRRNVV